jgi:hypothetical protein
MFRTIIFTVVFFAFCVNTGNAQLRKTDREKAGLIGSVRSVTSASADFIGGKIEGKGYSLQPPETVTYDETGNEFEDQMVSDFGEQMGKTVKKFGPESRLVESAWVDPKGMVVRKDVFEYADGRLSEIKTFDDKNVLRERIVHVYDETARLIEEVYYDPEKVIAKTIYTYNSGASKPVEIAFFLADGRKATAPFGPCLGAHRIVAAYDDKGRTLSQDVFEDTGALKKGYHWTYDGKSNISSYIIKSPGSTVTFLYSYEFDSRGNWIKRVAKGTSKEDGLDVFGKPATPYVRTTVTTRKIAYY